MRNIISLVIKIRMNIKRVVGDSMKKVIVTETDRYIIFVDIVLYLVIALMGFVILSIKDIDGAYTLKYLYVAFYVVAFFAVAAYFINRRKYGCFWFSN